MLPIKILKKKKKKASSKTCVPSPTTGVCLVVAVGLTQDLTLILSTKKHLRKQTNQNYEKTRIHLLQTKRRGIHCEEYRLYATASNSILENAIREEDMLCVTASFNAKKICCVLLPASL